MADKTVDIGHVAARLLSVALPMGLSIDEVIIDGEGLHIDGAPFHISLKQAASMEVRINEESLANFLNGKAPGGLREFKVGLTDGQIHIEAKATMIITLTVGAICQLVIEDGSKLVVELIKVDAIGGTGAHNIVQKQLDNINPVLDAKDFPFDASFQSVSIQDQWLTLKGTIAPKAE